MICQSGSVKPSQDYDSCIACPDGGTCFGASVSCQSGYYFDGNVQCKRNDTFFALLSQTTERSLFTVTQAVTISAPISQLITVSAVATNFQTVTISNQGSPSQQQSQASNSITVDFIGTLPISPLIFAVACIGVGAFVMLIFALVCCRKSTQTRKNEEIEGMTATGMNTTSQITFTNSTR